MTKTKPTKLIDTAGMFAGYRGSAAHAYAIRSGNVAELLRRFTKALAAHRDRAAAKPGDWGLPGDLACVEGPLAEALAALGDDSGVRELGIER